MYYSSPSCLIVRCSLSSIVLTTSFILTLVNVATFDMSQTCIVIGCSCHRLAWLKLMFIAFARFEVFPNQAKTNVSHLLFIYNLLLNNFLLILNRVVVYSNFQKIHNVSSCAVVNNSNVLVKDQFIAIIY